MDLTEKERANYESLNDWKVFRTLMSQWSEVEAGLAKKETRLDRGGFDSTSEPDVSVYAADWSSPRYSGYVSEKDALDAANIFGYGLGTTSSGSMGRSGTEQFAAAATELGKGGQESRKTVVSGKGTVPGRAPMAFTTATPSSEDQKGPSGHSKGSGGGSSGDAGKGGGPNDGQPGKGQNRGSGGSGGQDGSGIPSQPGPTPPGAPSPR
eukprot:715337-Amphidinium_carterae.1